MATDTKLLPATDTKPVAGIDTRATAGISTMPARLAPHAWQPGKSGNPSGRPSSAHISEIIRARTNDGATLVDVLLEIVEGKHRARAADISHAAEVLLDRCWGKAVQALEVSGPDGAALGAAALDGLSTEELRVMVAQRERLLAQRERLLRLLEAAQSEAVGQPVTEASYQVLEPVPMSGGLAEEPGA